ncbi:MAG: FAD-dependent monooxygenase [Thermodesulfobacteriota bacterium]
MKPPTNSDLDILVVGAGPTGLVMAVEAARHGMSCRIIDKAPEPSDRSKALVVQARTLEVFDAMGSAIVQEAIDCGQPMRSINAYADSCLIAQMQFDGLDSPYPFPLILEQSQTERILGKHLEGLRLKVERQVELIDFKQDEACVTAIIQHSGGYKEALRASWLVGCDGAHSVVRHILDLPFEGAPYEEVFLLADVVVHWTMPPAQGYFFFTSLGIMAVIPMHGDKRYRLIATRDKSSAKDYQDPTLEEMQNILKARVHMHAEIGDPVWLSGFRLHRRIVPKLRVGRVFLAGDAAHIHSPAGGQGMNTGIQDTFNLAWKLALVIKGVGRSILLDSYHQERHPVAKAVLRGTDLLFRTFLGNNPMVIKSLRIIAPLLLHREWVQRRVRNIVSELEINYRRSPIVGEYPKRFLKYKTKLAAGDRAPDCLVTMLPNKINIRLFELFRGTKFALLVFSGINCSLESCENLASICNTIQSKYGQYITVYMVLTSETPQADLNLEGSTLLDYEKSLHHKYEAGSNCLYLVRPDGYIGFKSQPINTEHLQEYLYKIFI